MMNDHNEYLKLAETYLEDLPVMEKSKILSLIHDQIVDMQTADLDDPIIVVNKKRIELGHYPFKYKEKPSILNFFLKLSAIMTIFVFTLIAIVIWKFTPLFHVDEENNRVIILGGLIDIDGKAGRFKVGNNYQFTEAKYENEFQGSFELDQEKDEVVIKFISGSFKLSTATDNEVKINCKLETPPQQDMIVQSHDAVEVDFTKMQGSSCSVIVPQDRKVTLEGHDSNIEVLEPEFNLYVDITNGNLQFIPAPEIDYSFNVEVENGYKGDFPPTTSSEAFEIKFNIENGSAVLK
jgi:hypothetical protein